MLDVNQILNSLEETFRQNKSIDGVLDQIMANLGGRAIGLWRLDAGYLVQVGFRAVQEMDEQVSQQFALATQNVSLENTGLGIVKAIIDQKPAIGTLKPEESGLKGSSEWLHKFGAQQSYAIPVREAETGVGVLAISTQSVHQTGDVEWEIFTQIAEGIGERNLLGML